MGMKPGVSLKETTSGIVYGGHSLIPCLSHHRLQPRRRDLPHLLQGFEEVEAPNLRDQLAAEGNLNLLIYKSVLEETLEEQLSGSLYRVDLCA